MVATHLGLLCVMQAKETCQQVLLFLTTQMTYCERLRAAKSVQEMNTLIPALLHLLFLLWGNCKYVHSLHCVYEHSILGSRVFAHRIVSKYACVSSSNRDVTSAGITTRARTSSTCSGCSPTRWSSRRLSARASTSRRYSSTRTTYASLSASRASVQFKRLPLECHLELRFASAATQQSNHHACWRSRSCILVQAYEELRASLKCCATYRGLYVDYKRKTDLLNQQNLQQIRDQLYASHH